MKGNSSFSIFKHVPDIDHLVALQELFVKQIRVKLNSHFADLFIDTIVSKPSVGKICADANQFFIAYLVDVISHNTLGSFTIQNQVQFNVFMRVERKIELAFYSRKYGKAIVLGQWCYLSEYIHCLSFPIISDVS
jgi:hypothetical protein